MLSFLDSKVTPIIPVELSHGAPGYLGSLAGYFIATKDVWNKKCAWRSWTKSSMSPAADFKKLKVLLVAKCYQKKVHLLPLHKLVVCSVKLWGRHGLPWAIAHTCALCIYTNNDDNVYMLHLNLAHLFETKKNMRWSWSTLNLSICFIFNLLQSKKVIYIEKCCNL